MKRSTPALCLREIESATLYENDLATGTREMCRLGALEILSSARRRKQSTFGGAILRGGNKLKETSLLNN
jgi:hypothetical protein